MVYKIGKLDELYHYGVKGMKWGVRKEYKPIGHNKSPRKSTIDNREVQKNVRQNDKKIDRAHKNHDRIVKKAKSVGKSAAEIEQEEALNKKLTLTDKQKKAIAIGVVVAGTALATYGAYKYASNRSGESFGRDLLRLGKSVPGSDSGNTDFLRNSFRDCGDYHAFSNTQSNKNTINQMLTKSSGEWWSGLTKYEQHGISKYSSNAYSKMNNALWAAKGKDISDFTDSITAANIKAANSALEKASFPTSMVTTQGLSLKNACSFLGCSEEELCKAATNPDAASKFIGAVNINYGLFSTSSTANSGFSGGVKYKVLTPKGAHAAFIEHISDFGDLPHPPKWDGKKSGGPPFSSEFETLFAAGSRFKTRGIQYNKVGGFIEVALEYILED